jgi:hypothetical protein
MFLATSSQPDAIWFRLVQVLMNFANELPPELRRYRQQLDEENMRLQWAEHAELIMANLIRREPGRPEYQRQIGIVRSEIARLGGHPREDGNSNGGGNEEFRIRNTVIEP